MLLKQLLLAKELHQVALALLQQTKKSWLALQYSLLSIWNRPLGCLLLFRFLFEVKFGPPLLPILTSHWYFLIQTLKPASNQDLVAALCCHPLFCLTWLLPSSSAPVFRHLIYQKFRFWLTQAQLSSQWYFALLTLSLSSKPSHHTHLLDHLHCVMIIYRWEFQRALELSPLGFVLFAANSLGGQHFERRWTCSLRSYRWFGRSSWT